MDESAIVQQASPGATTDRQSVRSGRCLAQFAWALFDWANSPFTTLIITFVFPAYFATAIVGDEVRGQAMWGYALAASGLAVAVLSPPLGAIADAGGRRKPWILGFTLVCMVGSTLLWFAVPMPGAVAAALLCVAVANLGFEFGAAFNNAMLPDIVCPARLGRLSGWAWALGYAGGLVALALALLLLSKAEILLPGIDPQQAEPVRLLGPLTAIWFGLFIWPLFVFTPDRPARGLGIAAASREGLRRLRATAAELRKRRDVVRFLAAHMLYADGLATLFAFGGVYAAGTFGMNLSEVVAFGVALNIAAGLGAFLFGWVDDWIGSRRTVALALVGLIAGSIAAVSVDSTLWLWVSGCFLGLFVGPVQASSRALMARLSPPDRQTEYFGLFALSGKATAFAGPALVAFVTDITGRQRLGIATLIVFLAAGLWLLVTGGRAATQPAPCGDNRA